MIENCKNCENVRKYLEIVENCGNTIFKVDIIEITKKM